MAYKPEITDLMKQGMKKLLIALAEDQYNVTYTKITAEQPTTKEPA